MKKGRGKKYAKCTKNLPSLIKEEFNAEFVVN